MALLASGHAAFKTGSQIVVTDFVEGVDDLLLRGIGQFHFALRGHTGIYVARTFEPGFSADRGRSR
jgi:hypothetical protein